MAPPKWDWDSSRDKPWFGSVRFAGIKSEFPFTIALENGTLRVWEAVTQNRGLTSASEHGAEPWASRFPEFAS